jgi:acyl-CoA reductase-like NAD-dependent aldehyde dehydrogenase
LFSDGSPWTRPSIIQKSGIADHGASGPAEFRHTLRTGRRIWGDGRGRASQAARLGRLACEETGFGKPEDKEQKNLFATRGVWESIAQLKTVGVIHEDHERQIVSIGEPMGIVAALIPSTNPTSTVMFKALISVKARNGIVRAPTQSRACTAEAMHVVRDAAERRISPVADGMPSIPTAEGTQELMRHKLTSVILARKPRMVRAAQRRQTDTAGSKCSIVH